MVAPLPVATLSVEYQMVNPPHPIGVAVMVGGKIIAVIELQEFKSAAARLWAAEADIERGKAARPGQGSTRTPIA